MWSVPGARRTLKRHLRGSTPEGSLPCAAIPEAEGKAANYHYREASADHTRELTGHTTISRGVVISAVHIRPASPSQQCWEAVGLSWGVWACVEAWMLPASFLQEQAGFCSCCTELLAVKARLFLSEAAYPAQPLVPLLLCNVVKQHNALARYSHQTVGFGSLTTSYMNFFYKYPVWGVCYSEQYGPQMSHPAIIHETSCELLPCRLHPQYGQEKRRQWILW